MSQFFCMCWGMVYTLKDISYGFAECPGSFACAGVCYAH